MTYQRCPHNRGQCPFHIVPNNPLSAEESIKHCVKCVTANNDRLYALQEDFHQIAYLTILNSLPEYDPNHPSGASLITFIKARVCTRLWTERRKELVYLPYPYTEQPGCADCGCDQACGKNPLVAELNRQACSQKAMEDKVIEGIEIENLRKYLPHLMENLSDAERRVIQMKFFDEYSGVEIADTLGISQGRVSQLAKKALAKVGKAYFIILGATTRNPYI